MSGVGAVGVPAYVRRPLCPRRVPFSTCFLRSAIFTSSVASFFCSVSTSDRFDTAASIAFWMFSIARSASSCFTVNIARCSFAVLLSLSTSAVASRSLDSPPLRCSTRSDSLARCDEKRPRQHLRNPWYISGVAPVALRPPVASACELCTETICLTSCGRACRCGECGV